ncbi:MAG: Fosmidomycin resistance protein [Syntrophorhabdus sp. PtaU1.Bin058]|nr:MAG: Fosmidomycin resistance protein [Syntrophorhabdus sp. PtaU1.Bin058]
MNNKWNLKVLILLSLGHLVTDIYQGALPVTLPFIKEKLALSYTMTGLILMISNFTSSILQPLFGFYSDRKAKAILLPIGLLCAGIGFSFISIPNSYAVILAMVAVSGLGIASYHPEGYKTANFFTGEKSVTGMAIFSVGGNLGFSLGPILSVYIVQYLGLSSLPVIVIPSLVVTAIIIYQRKVITIPVVEHAKRQAEAPKAVSGAYLSLFMLIVIVVMRSWTQMGLLSYIPFYYINYMKGDPLYAGKLVFVYLLCGAIGTMIGAPLADRWGHRRFLRITMFLAAATLPLMFFVKGPMLFFVLGFQGMFLVSTFAVTVVMAQKLLPARLGIASGLMVGFAIGTGGIGVTVLGIVADNFGVPVALESIMALPFIGLVLSLMLRYRERV